MNNTFKPLIYLGFLAAGCNSGQNAKPDWADINAKVIKENNVKGRTRDDIPNTGVKSNLEAGKVINVSALPQLELAPGVTAKAYWGSGALMSFIKLAPNAAAPEATIKGERFLYVLEGEVNELVNGQAVTLRSSKRETPDGVHGATPKNEFLYLLDGAKTSVKAGANGAEILEVFSPVPAEYLAKSGVKDVPVAIDLNKFPVPASVEPNKVYDLNDIQYSELVPGSNARIISGKGLQMSFLRMNANAYFAHHIHPEEQVMYTFRGSIDEILLDKQVNMKTGDIVDLPPNFVHGGKLGPLGCDALDVFFPPRTDYNTYRETRQKGYNAIIPADAQVKTVLDGATTKPALSFTEGPAWMNGKLYFSNMYFDKDFNGSPAKSTTVEMSPDGTYRNIVKNKMQTNGIISTADNHLLVCDMFGHRIVEMDTNGKIIKTLADKYDGKPLDGPNDLVMDAKGGLYFSDPQFTADKTKNQPGRTVYYRDPQGKITRLLEPNAFAMPNGLALSPDGKTLYINNTYDDEKTWNVNSDKENFVWAYDVQADGTITNPKKFAELYLTEDVLERKSKTSGADGMKVDEKGNLYVATYAGLQIFDKAGKFVGIINFPTYPVNCAFGGEDGQTLYVTSYNKIYSIRTNVKGLSRTR